MADPNEAAILRAAELLAGARKAIAFTGAGISKESGVPTFRGEGGLWERIDPGTLEISRYRRDPETCWKAIRELFYSARPAPRPNAAHRVLAAWEAAGLLSFVITQNIDGLHRAAGTRRLAEFHGSISRLACPRCGASVDAGPERLEAGLLDRLPPPCPSCGGPLKPDFVFFGEPIPIDAYRASVEAAEGADLCLVIGSTGVVYPAAEMPYIVKGRGGTIVEVDPGETEFTREITDVHVRLGASEALRSIDSSVTKIIAAQSR